MRWGLGDGKVRPMIPFVSRSDGRRSAGRLDFVEFHLELDDHMPLMVAHEVSDNVEDAIISALPQADVMIHLDPVSLAEEQLDEKIEAVENPSRN